MAKNERQTVTLYSRPGGEGNRPCDPDQTDDRSATINDLAASAVARLLRNAKTPTEQSGPSGQARQSARPVGLPPHVIAMAHAAAFGDDDAAPALVAALLEAGISLQDLCSDHLTPAARALGDWWQADRLAFADVTYAIGRMQGVIRSFPPVPLDPLGPDRRRVLLVLAPGDTHTFGLVMATDYFRRNSWDVAPMIGATAAEVLRRTKRFDGAVVALGCACCAALPGLCELVAEIRAARPDLRLVLSGWVVSEPGLLNALPKVDATASSMEDAEALCAGYAQEVSQRV